MVSREVAVSKNWRENRRQLPVKGRNVPCGPLLP